MKVLIVICCYTCDFTFVPFTCQGQMSTNTVHFQLYYMTIIQFTSQRKQGIPGMLAVSVQTNLQNQTTKSFNNINMNNTRETKRARSMQSIIRSKGRGLVLKCRLIKYVILNLALSNILNTTDTHCIVRLIIFWFFAKSHAVKLQPT